MQQPTVNENVRVYSHETLHGALAALKGELGENAMILHTRQVRKKGRFGIGAQSVFEIQACPSPEKKKAQGRPDGRSGVCRGDGHRGGPRVSR